MFSAFAAGFALSFSLILAIGAQNAFVLRQGLRREHVLLVCLTCAVSDALLIAAGVAGFASATARLSWLEPVLRFGGAAFLLWYAARSLRSALQSQHAALEPAAGGSRSAAKILAATLAFTWLNPHVYLDTLVLLGSISSQYEGQRPLFAAGAMLASFTFFFALGFGARLLRPVFANPRAWRLLDGLVGLCMLAIALHLLAQGA